MIPFLFLLIGGIIAVAAFKGRGYRGAYIAGAMLMLVLGFGCFSMPGGLPPGATLAEQRGAEFIDTYAGDVGLGFVFVSFGCLMAAALYRKRP